MAKAALEALTLQLLERDLEDLRRAAAGCRLRAFVEAARAGQNVEGLLASAKWVRFELDGDDVLLTWQDADGRFHTSRGAGLADALNDVDVLQEGKTCMGPCGTWRPLLAYSRDANRRDGKCQRCKRCEVLRQRQYQKPGKKRKAKTAGQSA